MEGGHALAGHEQLEDLIEQPRRGNLQQQRRGIMDGGFGARVEVEVELGGEAHRPEHPHRVLSIAGYRVADQPQGVGLDIADPVGEVVDREIGDIVVQGVDREVAAQGVFLDIAPDIVAQQQAIVGLLRDMVGMILVGLATERGDLDHLATEANMHDAEASANDARVTEQVLDLIRRGVRGDIEVLGHMAQQRVTDAPADKEGLEASIVEAVEHLQGGVAEVLTRDGMFRAGNDARPGTAGRRILWTEQRPDALARTLQKAGKTFDHAAISTRRTRKALSVADH